MMRLSPAFCGALILFVAGCGEGPTKTPPSNQQSRVNVALNTSSVQNVRSIPTADIKSHIEARKLALKPILDDANDPRHAIATKYVEQSKSVVDHVDKLQKELAPLNDALSKNDFKTAAGHANAELLADLEGVRKEIQQLSEISESVVPESDKKDDKSFWEKVLEIILIIIRIILFLIEIFGSGDGGEGDGGGAEDDAGGDGTSGPTVGVMQSAPGRVSREGVTQIGSNGVDHLARLDSEGDASVVVLAIEKDPSKTVRLPLHKTGSSVAISNIQVASTSKPFPLKATVTIDGAEEDLEWTADSEHPRVIAGTNPMGK